MNPNKPIIRITDVAQPNNGIKTHLIFLKINQRVIIIKIKTLFKYKYIFFNKAHHVVRNHWNTT